MARDDSAFLEAAQAVAQQLRPASQPTMRAFFLDWAPIKERMMDTHDNPGYDATPGYCLLCEEPFTADDGPVDTTWGLFHLECANSHDSAAGEPLDGEA